MLLNYISRRTTLPCTENENMILDRCIYSVGIWTSQPCSSQKTSHFFDKCTVPSSTFFLFLLANIRCYWG